MAAYLPLSPSEDADVDGDLIVVADDLSDLLEFAGELVIDPCPKHRLLVPFDPERVEIRGTGERDHLFGTDGHDRIVAFSGDDWIFGSDGYDEIVGGPGFDTVSYRASPCGVFVDLEARKGWGGHAHGDTYSAVEAVEGSLHDDTLLGRLADNRLDGLDGNDSLHGAGGDDTLRGGRGDDTLDGGNGDDVLYGGNGENLLTGGEGADTFEFLFAPAVTTIADFTLGEDRIVLTNSFYDFGWFMNNAVQVGDDVVLERENTYLNYTARLIIENVALGDLTSADIVYI